MSYLNAMVLPSAKEQPSQERRQEMRTLAESLNALEEGQIARVGDVLSQRFKSLKMKSQGGHPKAISGEVEAVGPSKQGLVGEEELVRAKRRLLRKAKLERGRAGS